MDRKKPREAAAKAAKAATASMGTYWITATAAIVLVLVGVVTAIVTTKPTPALIGALILLAALSAVLAAMQQHSTQSPPAAVPASGPGVFDPSAENPYGAPFFTRQAFRLSTFPYPASGLFPVPRAEPGPLVNRDGERELLDRTLRADRSDVIVVHGPPGAGKSTLVSNALRDAGLSETMVRRYNYPGDRFDAKTLCEDLDPSTRSGTGPRPGEDVLTRLQAAVEPPDDTPAFIVVDGAQYLLDPDTHAFISLELAEAIGVIARGWRRVKLILLFQERPVPKAGSEWLESADAIAVKGLAREHWEECLQQLDPGGKFGLATLTPAERDGLHDALRGIPRLAELFRTVLELPRNHWNAAGLARHLANQPAGAAERLLAGELVDSLGDEQRRVTVGLTAYGTPVTLHQLKDLLEEELSPGRVPTLLAELTGLHVISMTSDRYYVPTSAIQDALMRLPHPDGPAHLWSRATDLLSRSRKEQVQQPEDLDVYFAELDILIRRQMWGSCYELIDTMEKQLQRWNAAALLLRYRETIAGKLQRSFREMVNYNALGCIYLSLGKLGQAQQAFDNALRNADAVADRYPHGRRKIYINLGALGLESGETARAEHHYRDALAMAGEHDDVPDRMAAMAGLADCSRRHGEYDEAIRCGKLALSAAQDRRSPWAADIAVKLARWHSELDRREEAFRLIDVADQEAAEHPEDPSLRVRCLDGRADLLLDAGDFGRARDVAQDALTRALELNGPVTVLQTRTTMAMACLRLDQMDIAIREIDRAAPYRRAGRSLVVLALQALIAFRADPDAEDARKLFAQLERAAVQRRERDVRDFAAWDFEGLASCGTRVGRAGSLDPAIAAFRHAREQAAPPGLIARMQFWLGILQAKASPGQMDPVLAAAVGSAARPERP